MNRRTVGVVFVIGGVAMLLGAVVAVGAALTQVQRGGPTVVARGTVGAPVTVPAHDPPSSGYRGYTVYAEVRDGHTPVTATDPCTVSGTGRSSAVLAGRSVTVEGSTYVQIATVNVKDGAQVTCTPLQAAPTAQVLLATGRFVLPGGPLIPGALAVAFGVMGLGGLLGGLAMLRRTAR
ncbi:MAG: hypothetical protein ACTHLJ_07835 [Angustibacter sp.]